MTLDINKVSSHFLYCFTVVGAALYGYLKMIYRAYLTNIFSANRITRLTQWLMITNFDS